MINFCFKISKKYYFSLTLLHKVREFNDGITFIECETSLDLYKMEHNPKFQKRLIILNYTIFDLEVYKVLTPTID